ncbi:efflux RND transporter periplasmic adaptor subunit [endosymbiont of unidentified scaly snail isolate Monju]|uniref:efflux RND transporter periplasmic adaptor subunit n=1 Tax=endosymbiont of unidentified scaly snail isolate Monju TaxID=1248727 RepID=UPI0003892418|nr:RND superfamily efflux transporter MFP subunit [endosymbiont of unidentified scaly snail isolate Monju]
MREGQRVKQGQLLLELWNDDLHARLDLARRETEAQLSKTRLTAPFDGVVAQINGELAEYVTPSPIGIATSPAIDLLDDRCFYVSAPIDEVDVGKVRPGQPARITLDAFGERRFAGQVRRIADYVLDREKQARTVEVEIAFTDVHDLPRLLAGYSADVEILFETRRDVLRIPSEALVENRYVFVLRDDGILERREVTAGVGNWDYTEIRDGLREGERVVTSLDREGLADGAPARLESEPR